MQFYDIKLRIAQETDKDDLYHLLPNWINETRESIALKYPLRFLYTSRVINLIGSTFDYTFDTGSTSRYSGFYDSVVYYNGTSYIPLSYAELVNFNILFPSTATGEPSSFTTKGNTFTVDKIPSTTTSKTFTAKYYMLPDKLSNEYDEAYIDKKYYEAIINLVCMKAMAYVKDYSEDFVNFRARAGEYLFDLYSQESIVPVSKERIVQELSLMSNLMPNQAKVAST